MRARPAALIAALFMLIGIGISPAQAAEGLIDTYEVDASVSREGQLSYQATMTFSDLRPDDLTIQLRTQADAPNKVIQHFEITELTLSDATGPLEPAIETADQTITISLDPAELEGPLVLAYQVAGATHAGPADTTVFSWPVIQGVSAPIARATGRVGPGSPVTDYLCKSGPLNALSTCSLYSGGSELGPDLIFEEQRLQPGELVQASMTYEPGLMPVTEQLEYRWSLDRAFGHSIANLLVAALVAVIGLVMLAHLNRRIGSDAPAGEPVSVARFTSVGAGQSAFEVSGGVRPGLVGTLTDETVDPVDITATILDLATRGHLRITELEPSDAYAPLDWRITRRPGGQGELAPYEQILIDAIDPEQGQLVSRIDAISGAAPALQNALYDEVVARGWYQRRPDDVRSGFSRAGIIAVVVAIAALIGLVAFTSFGILGLVLLSLAALFLTLSGRMPARTAQGSAVLQGLGILSGQLLVHPTDEMPRGHELRELSRVLPYAVVLGGSQRWLDAIVAADDDETPDATDLDWYHAPPDWHLDRLPESLDALITTMQGRLFRR